MHFGNGPCCGKADAAASTGLGTGAVAAIEAVEQVFWRAIGQFFVEIHIVAVIAPGLRAESPVKAVSILRKST